MVKNPSFDALLLLHHLPGVGPATFKRLLEWFGSPEHVFEQPFPVLSELLNPAAQNIVKEYRSSSTSRVHEKLAGFRELLAHQQVTVLTEASADYPSLLKTIPKAPPVLYVRGNLDCLHLPQLAVVGSRHATPAGIENTRHFTRHMARAGFAITSGLALGIDAAAHKACLEAKGRTLAVLGTGIDRAYPVRNRHLAEQILDGGGALISEFPLGTTPMAANFPRRNRIISGLSLGVLVIEAALKSGSLITAAVALEQGREVFAIPGSIHNPVSRGCHRLIKNGAALVESADDILEQLGGMLDFKYAEVAESQDQFVRKTATELLDKEQQILMLSMGFEPIDIERLANRTGLSVAQLSGQLIELELKGLIARCGQGYQRVS